MVNEVQRSPNCTFTAMRISLDILNTYFTELLDEKKQETIHKVCGIVVMRLYKKLYGGEVTISFDLACSMKQFDYTDDFPVFTKENFPRKLRGKSEIMNAEDCSI
jgi:hypothetical protein